MYVYVCIGVYILARTTLELQTCLNIYTKQVIYFYFIFILFYFIFLFIYFFFLLIQGKS